MQAAVSSAHGISVGSRTCLSISWYIMPVCVCPRYIQAASTPKNIIILLDTSGSMTGKRFTIAQSTVSTILDTLSDEDYFNIIKVRFVLIGTLCKVGLNCMLLVYPFFLCSLYWKCMGVNFEIFTVVLSGSITGMGVG